LSLAQAVILSPPRTSRFRMTGGARRNSDSTYVSEAVFDEIRKGNPTYAAKRIEIIRDLEILAFSADVALLIREYHARNILTGSATTDLAHFAYAVAYNLDYLVTWNCRHIANGQVIKRLTKVNEAIGRPIPLIVTPEELLSRFYEGSE
jgi:hypothetical protein